MDLIDIGINLGNRSYRSDMEEVLASARAAGVRRMVVTGTSLAESRHAAKLAESHPEALSSTAGVHPHDARHWDPQAPQVLRELAALPQVVAIGECGLDFNRDFSPRPQQESCFASQLDLAVELSLPVFLHERDAHERFRKILGYQDLRALAAILGEEGIAPLSRRRWCKMVSGRCPNLQRSLGHPQDGSRRLVDGW